MNSKRSANSKSASSHQGGVAERVERTHLQNYLHELLRVDQFKDYCPNGLQVQGKAEIRRIVSGVTACTALIEQAIALQADALLVHHGYFWRGENPCITGQKQQRLKLLLQHDLNLFAFHLPLDAHPTLGNNAQLGLQLGFEQQASAGEQNLVALGQLVRATSLAALSQHVEKRLQRTPLLVGDPTQKVQHVAWCTGAAQSMIESAASAGAQVYLSGEISEPTAHFCREMGIAYLACGHHATERYGVQALGEHLAQKFGLAHHFIDIDNPA